MVYFFAARFVSCRSRLASSMVSKMLSKMISKMLSKMIAGGSSPGRSLSASQLVIRATRAGSIDKN